MGNIRVVTSGSPWVTNLFRGYLLGTLGLMGGGYEVVNRSHHGLPGVNGGRLKVTRVTRGH